jgi:hypothetical protein
VRLLLCLPLCLLLAPGYPCDPLVRPENAEKKVAPSDVFGDPRVPDPRSAPVAFLEACLKHYDDNVHSYSLLFDKQERVEGKLRGLEVVKVYYRDRPLSVYFHWLQTPDKLIRRALYVEGENKGLVRVDTPLGMQNFAPDSASAKQRSRYPINEFGLRQAMKRVYDTWLRAKAENTLHVEYHGQVAVPEVGGRTCYKLRRVRYARPEEEDGVFGLTLFIDCETLLQVGSIVLGTEGEKLGEYFFRDIHLNPEIPAWQFTSEAFKKD